MKKLLYILILTVLFLTELPEIYAQYETNLAKVNITNKLLTGLDTYEFELRLIRKDPDLWDRWANGTFQIYLRTADTNGIDYDNLTIELVNDSTDLTPLYAGGAGDPWNELPDNEYHITPGFVADTFGRKISITIAGPEEYDDCIEVLHESEDSIGILLGKFRVSTNDGSNLPEDIDLEWALPLDFYQASAYKREREDDETPWHNYDPNLPMSDFKLGYYAEYSDDNDVDTCFIVKNFEAEYAGNFLVRLSWDTECELRNRGFFILRGLRPYDVYTPENVPMTDTVADYLHSPEEDAILSGLGTAKPGTSYVYEFDEVERWGEEYCYQLLSRDYYGNVRSHGYSCVFIPNTVISFAEGSPNPFKQKTTITYRLEHDAYLTVKITDVNGKEVKKVYENKLTQSGEFLTFEFEPTDLAQQGLYDIIFLAKPVENINVELARAVVKVMFVK